MPARGIKTELKKDKTVGICSVCNEVIAHECYSIKKFGKRIEPAIICQWCKAKLK